MTIISTANKVVKPMKMFSQLIAPKSPTASTNRKSDALPFMGGYTNRIRMKSRV
jgi:hypothetical protein